jgi:histidinol-phosphate aminotransferase
VLEALARIRADQIGVYPPYSGTISACAHHLGVDPGCIALTNGLDEAILAVAVAHLRSSPGGFVPEAIVPQPAFEIFAFDAEVVGGRVVRVAPRLEFDFQLDEIVAAVTPATRVVFLTNPNNPTGLRVPAPAIREIARAVPHGIVFVDEAYADFSGETFVPELEAYPNVIVGRTFSKAFGLAGLRIGAVIGAPAALEPIRRIVPVYSINVAAAAALEAAIADRQHVLDYLRQVRESKALVYAMCDRLGLKYWRSEANFVLIRTGGEPAVLVEEAAARGIYLRDRSEEPGCAGCIRFTAGIVEHTRRGLAVLEEVLCAVR